MDRPMWVGAALRPAPRAQPARVSGMSILRFARLAFGFVGANQRAAPTRLHLPLTFLPVHLQTQLQLPRIVRSCGLSGVGEQRADRSHVVSVRDVEDV